MKSQPITSPQRLYLRLAGGSRIALEDNPLTIGRHGDNRLVIADDLANRHHCIIEKTDDGFMLRDLESVHGTLLNDQPIKKSLVIAGDKVTIGNTTFKFVTAKRKVPVELPVRAELAPEPAHGRNGSSHDDVSQCEVVLKKLADSLPSEMKFDAGEIALLNARGHVEHPANGHSGAGGDIIRLMRQLLVVSFKSRATDLHIEPDQECYHVRIRVDGTLVDAVELPRKTGIRMAAVVKVLSEIDPAKQTTSQEGHFACRLQQRRVDYRVSFVPAMYGQNLVIRVLDGSNAPLHVRDLQLPQWMYESLHKAVGQEGGMILACGPTGSGKTTTLYALVRDIDIAGRNVVTIEDPVEMRLERVTQIPVNDQQGNTFSNLLRSVLRQVPDAIMVGEIRDPETARIAMQSALTGHLVFSSLHARDTVGSIFRLLDLGIEPYLIASGLHLIVSQRLVRQLCKFCKTQVAPTPAQNMQLAAAGFEIGTIYTAVGCESCLQTGYSGRRAIFELLEATETMREAILKNPTLRDMHVAATISGKFQRLHDSGMVLVAEGVTSFDEVDRVAGHGETQRPVSV